MEVILKTLIPKGESLLYFKKRKTEREQDKMLWEMCVMIKMSPYLFNRGPESSQNGRSATAVPLHPWHCGLERKKNHQ